MNVEEIMTPDPYTVDLDTSVGELAKAFESKPIHHLIVMEKRKAVGVISDRDVLRAISPFAGTHAETRRDTYTTHKKAHQIMTRQLITVTEGDHIKVAAQRILDNKISCLPVLNKSGALTGIITWRDLLRFALNRKQ